MKPRITAADAIAIYKLKPVKRRASGNLSTHLAQQYSITEKAVRDIWQPRTWKRVTKPFWTPQDQECFMKKKGCAECHKNGVKKLAPKKKIVSSSSSSFIYFLSFFFSLSFFLSFYLFFSPPAPPHTPSFGATLGRQGATRSRASEGEAPPSRRAIRHKRSK